MIDHVGFPVSHYGRAKAFYSAALAPLGYTLMMEVTNEQTGGHGDHAGFGDTRPDFWIGTGKAAATATHVAFHAKDRATVDAFVRSDPYHVNKVWETVQIHGYNKKRGTPIASLRS